MLCIAVDILSSHPTFIMQQVYIRHLEGSTSRKSCEQWQFWRVTDLRATFQVVQQQKRFSQCHDFLTSAFLSHMLPTS